MEFTHIAYSDESSKDERFQSVCVVTLTRESDEDLANELQAILQESDLKEFKWSKLRNAKYRLAAEKLIKWATSKVLAKQITIDVLIWDMQDSRHHNVVGRDNEANLGRMYYHILHHVFSNRWEAPSMWLLRPDQNSALDWDTLEQCLMYSGRKVSNNRAIRPFFTLPEKYSIATLEEIDSCLYSMCQIADLFGGMACFSYNHSGTFITWQQQDQIRLPEILPEAPKLSGGETERSHILQVFLDLKLSYITVKAQKERPAGLKTVRREGAINFWFYEPQHEQDKAPTKPKK